MGNKIKKTIKEIELRSLAVAVLGITILALIANYAYITSGTSAWNPNPTSVSSDVAPWYKGPSDIIPALIGDKIAWQDNRNGNWDIYMYDPSNREEYQITTELRDQYTPDISGNIIVWQDHLGPPHIYMYNILTREETRVSSIPNNSWPAISGNIIVWENIYNDIYTDLYMYNIITGRETRITTSGHAMWPAISGDKIVWTDDRNSNNDIYMYDITTGIETQITLRGKYVWRGAAISGDTIVWQEHINGIWMYDISTGAETQITSSTRAQYPDIWTDKIVWVEDRKDIYIYLISSGKKSQITTSATTKEDPVISGRTIVWQENYDDVWNICVYDFSFEHIPNFYCLPIIGDKDYDQIYPAIG